MEHDKSRNWTEDFGHENGNYECHCVECKQSFVGHKRRVLCKVCSTALRDKDDQAFTDYVNTLTNLPIVCRWDVPKPGLLMSKKDNSDEPK